MQSQYENSTGHLVIEWYEKKKDKSGKAATTSSQTHHYFSGIPTALQFHPKEPNMVVRATFIGETYGKMPGWLEKYATEHGFECQQAARQGEVGWWIANWSGYSSGMKPLSSPHIQGALLQFCNLIPDVFPELRDKVKGNLETICLNLRHYPQFYETLGLYFRLEEIKKEGGCLLIEEEVIPSRLDGESDEEYRLRIEKDGTLERLIHEMIAPLPEPILSTEEEEREEEGYVEGILEGEFSEEELLIDLNDISFEEEPIEFINLELEDIMENEELLIQFENPTDVEEVEGLQEGSVEIIEDETVENNLKGLDSDDYESSYEEEPCSRPSNEETTTSEEGIEPVLMQEPMEEKFPKTLEIQEEPSLRFSAPKLMVIEVRDKKSGACEGQFSLF